MKLPGILRTLKWLLLLVAVGGFFMAWPRLKAEYYYFRMATTSNEIELTRDLQNLGQPAFPALIRLLKDPDRLDREYAAYALRYARDERVVSALIEVARNEPDESVRHQAIQSLGSIGDLRALPVLKELGWESYWARSELLHMGEGGKKVLLDYYHQEPEARSRAETLEIICKEPFKLKDDPEVRDAVRRGIKDRAWEVREQAVSCLSSMLGQHAIQEISPLLADPRPEVRARVCYQLAELGDNSGFEVARRILVDRSLSYRIRRLAVRAVARAGNQEAFEVLRQVKDSDPSASMRDDAKFALREFFPGGDPRQPVRPSPR